MSFYNRVAITIVRLVAAGFLVIGVLDLALYWYQAHRQGVPMGIGRCVYLSIPLVIGVAILVKSSSLAAIIDQYLDE